MMEYFTKGSTTSSSAPPSGNVATALTSLTSIPRVSGVSCSNVNVGGTATIYITRADATYTDTLTYTIGNLTGTIATRTNQASVPFDTSSLKDAIYQQMSTSSQTIQGTIGIQTFNSGGTSIGTNSTTFTLTAVANDCKPVADFDLVTTDQKSYDLTGDHTTIIRARSECTITYTITPRNGATIVSKWFDFGDGTASDELPASPLTDWQLIGPSLKLVTTDSRGFVTEVPKTFGFVDYDAPYVSINDYRTSPTGSEIKANFQGTFFNGSFGAVTNTLTLKAKYRIKGASTWTDLKTLVENTDYTISNNTFYSGTGSVASDITLDSNVFDYQNTYEVAIFYNDEYYTGTNIYNSTFVSKGVPAFNWDDNLLNVNGDLTISDSDGANPVNVLSKINTNTTNINKIGRVLWQGTFSSGYIDVPYLNEYRTIIVGLANGVQCFGNQYYGIGGYGVYGGLTGATCYYRLGFNTSTNRVTIDTYNKGGNDGSGTAVAISYIVGVF